MRGWRRHIVFFLIFLVLTCDVALAANLSDFPGMFFKDGDLKATIVIGRNAPISEMLGAVDVALALVSSCMATQAAGYGYQCNLDTDGDKWIDISIMIDSEISDPAELPGDLILIGGPLSNQLVQQLGYTKWDFCDDADQALPCDAPIALIELKEDAFTVGKKAIVVAGWDVEQTRAGCYILQHYSDYLAKLTGSSLKFQTSAYATLPIDSMDISFW